MALTPSAVTVTATAAVVLAENTHGSMGAPDWNALNVLAKNSTATKTIYVGKSDVTSTTGWPWETTDGPLSFTLEAGEKAYGILASGDADQTVHVLAGGR